MVTNQEESQDWSEVLRHRRNDYDVTNTVRVSSPSAVCGAVHDLFVGLFPQTSFKPISRAFLDFQRLFNGEFPGYYGCDTVYHDIQHTLDMTLANARLIAGYERSHEPRHQLGPNRAAVSLVTSLFHDSGYIRRYDDEDFLNGAEFTRYHVSRSARFLEGYLPGIGLGDFSRVAARIVHFTGYEVKPQHIRLEDPKDKLLGHLLGSADLIAQMADRCYLEKCRDRLFPEFVLAGISIERDSHGNHTIVYESGDDLLTKTTSFYDEVALARLDDAFGSVYRFAEPLFGGSNPYMIAIENNLAYLRKIKGGEIGPLLRRRPPCFTWSGESLENVLRLAEQRQLKLLEPPPPSP